MNRPRKSLIKIIHLISDLSTGGAEVMLFRLLSHIDRSRFQNVVISLSGMGTLGAKIEALGIPVYTLGTSVPGSPNSIGTRQSLVLSFFGLWKLIALLRREQPAILQTWLYHSDLLGLIGGKLARVPSILWNVRCTALKSDRDWAMRFLAKLSAYPQGILVNSSAGRRFHESKGYHPRKWVLVPNGFDVERFRPDREARRAIRAELGVPEETFLIGLIARVDPLKDHANFLRAARELLTRRDDVRFVLVGLGTDSVDGGLMTDIDSLGLRRSVHLLGERQDVPAVMAALDVLTSSSSAEGFPNVVGEAMACGVPCVVTDVGDSAFLVGDTGKVVFPRRPDLLAQAWLELIEMDPVRRAGLGNAARERIKAHFDITSIVRRYEQYYDLLAGDGEMDDSGEKTPRSDGRRADLSG